MNFDLSFIEKQKANSYPSQRIYTEVMYALEVSRAKGGKYDSLIHAALNKLYSAFNERGALTMTDVTNLEGDLAAMTADCKSYELLLVSHSHIDMNWMWGFDETVSATLATFSTMLKLMREYPRFKFSQSQASCYEITEKYAPDMLDEIRAKVKEGRWEVTATQWVEGDKNLASGEDLSRHIQQSKDYLSALFSLPRDGFNLCFEPDTFGHNAFMPEILSDGGVKYMYHCRGGNPDVLYRWRAPSGKSVTVYCEPNWYNEVISGDSFLGYVPIMEKYGLNRFLRVYGVGDHGGGATRRDLNRIEDMMTWPVMPVLTYSTYAEFFGYIEKAKPKIITFEGELNSVFTGCYTSQSRIKKSNAVDARVLTDTEKAMAAANAYGLKSYCGKELDEGWRKHLFNQFHDILPGSCVTESRECALAYSMEVHALCGAKKTDALNAIANQVAVKTSPAVKGWDDGFSCCAGVGTAITSQGVYCGETGTGNRRVYLAFNPCSVDGEFIFSFRLWDYDGRVDALTVTDGEGNPLPFEIDKTRREYFFHKYYDLKVKCYLPALGYSCLIVSCDKEVPPVKIPDGGPPITDRDPDFVLEDDFVRAEFSPSTAALVRFKDKITGKEYYNPQGLAFFRYAEEDAFTEMTAWTQGRRKTDEPITKGVSIKDSYWHHNYKNDILNKQLVFSADFKNSRLYCTVKLENGALKYETVVDFREEGVKLKMTPCLEFSVNRAFTEYRFDVPYGVIERSGSYFDRPALSFIAGTDDGNGVMLLCEGKNGFRGESDRMTVSLIRGSFDPDPTPEIGKHEFTVILAPLRGKSNLGLLQLAEKLRTVIPVVPVTDSDKPRTLPVTAAPINYDGAWLTAFKPCQGGEGFIARFVETDGKESMVSVSADWLKKAYICDSSEIKLQDLKVESGKVKVAIKPYSVLTLNLIK